MTSPDAASLPPAYFEDIYATGDDPWSFASSPYEQAKYTATLAALPRQRYASAFEIGCSVGVLTARLAERCDALLSVDVAERPLEQARRRCRDQPWVRIERMQVPREFPDATFDLIVVSEVGYYWGTDDLQRSYEMIVDHLRTGGNLLLVHFTPFVDDYPLTGDEVHESVLAMAESGNALVHVRFAREATYRLDLFSRDLPG